MKEPCNANYFRSIASEQVDHGLRWLFYQIKEAAEEAKFSIIVDADQLTEHELQRLDDLGYLIQHDKHKFPYLPRDLDRITISWGTSIWEENQRFMRGEKVDRD